MNAAPGSAFRPNLDLLDEVIRSLSIDTSAVSLPSTSTSAASSNIPGMPGTGNPAGDQALLLLAAAGLAMVLVGLRVVAGACRVR